MKLLIIGFVILFVFLFLLVLFRKWLFRLCPECGSQLRDGSPTSEPRTLFMCSSKKCKGDALGATSVSRIKVPSKPVHPPLGHFGHRNAIGRKKSR